MHSAWSSTSATTCRPTRAHAVHYGMAAGGVAETRAANRPIPRALGESHDRVPCGCGAGQHASTHRLRGDSSHSRSRGGSPRWRCWPRTRARGSRRTSRPSSRPTSGSWPSALALRVVAKRTARSESAMGAQPATVVRRWKNPEFARPTRYGIGVNNFLYAVNRRSACESGSWTHALGLDLERIVRWYRQNDRVPLL